MPRKPATSVSLEDDPDLNADWEDDEEYEFDDTPPEADVGIPLPRATSGAHGWERERDPGKSAWSAADVKGVAPVFDGAVGDSVLEVHVEKAGGGWAIIGTFPARLGRDQIIEEVGRAGRYRVLLLGPDRKPVDGQVTVFEVDADNVTLRKARERASAGAGMGASAFPTVPANSLEDIRALVREQVEPQMTLLEQERRMLREREEQLRREFAEREARIRELEAEAAQQRMTASEILNQRGFEVMTDFQNKSTEIQNNQFASMTAMMQQQMQMAQLKHEQEMERVRAEQAAAERRLEEERKRAQMEHEHKLRVIEAEASARRERERREAEEERRLWEERQQRREQYERELREAREAREREERRERREREEREREREMTREERERDSEREERRFRREREDKLAEVQAKADPLGATIATVTAITGLLSQLGVEPGEIIKGMMGGAKTSVVGDVVKSIAEVLKATVEAGARMDDEDDEDDDSEVLLLEDGRQVRVTAEQAATIRQQAAAAGAQVDVSQATAFTGAPGPAQAAPSAPPAQPGQVGQVAYAQPGDFVISGETGTAVQGVASRLQAEAAATTPASATAPNPVHVTRDKISEFVADLSTEPQSMWVARFTAFITTHPDVLAYIGQTGIRPALRDAGASAEMVEQVIQLAVANGAVDGTPVPFG